MMKYVKLAGTVIVVLFVWATIVYMVTDVFRIIEEFGE